MAKKIKKTIPKQVETSVEEVIELPPTRSSDEPIKTKVFLYHFNIHNLLIFA